MCRTLEYEKAIWLMESAFLSIWFVRVVACLHPNSGHGPLFPPPFPFALFRETEVLFCVFARRKGSGLLEEVLLTLFLPRRW